MDFQDASTVRADPSGEGKRQHVVEVCHFVDAGTSILLSAQAHDAFGEETAFEAVLAFLHTYGLPPMLTFDRDPRWIGSSSGRDFPSPLVRFLTCLGIVANICPPHRPDQHAYVNGMIAKDKFCLSRYVRLHLAWSRQLSHSQQPQEAGMRYPSSKDQPFSQEDSHATHTTIMDHSASLAPQSRGMESLGSGVSVPARLDQSLS